MKARVHYEPPHSTDNSACGRFAESAESSADIGKVTCLICRKIYWTNFGEAGTGSET